MEPGCRLWPCAPETVLKSGGFPPLSSSGASPPTPPPHARALALRARGPRPASAAPAWGPFRLAARPHCGGHFRCGHRSSGHRSGRAAVPSTSPNPYFRCGSASVRDMRGVRGFARLGAAPSGTGVVKHRSSIRAPTYAAPLLHPFSTCAGAAPLLHRGAGGAPTGPLLRACLAYRLGPGGLGWAPSLDCSGPPRRISRHNASFEGRGGATPFGVSCRRCRGVRGQ